MEANEFFDALADVPNLRSANFVDVEMKATPSGYAFDGIAAPTGVTSDLGEFTEEYERGTFRRFLASCTDNIPFLHEHNPRDLMASTRSGRLKLEEDGRGLRTRADVVKTALSEQVKSLVDSGDIAGMSIGMVVGRGNAKIERRTDGRPHRRITNLRKLLDVCTTFDPAYATTEAQFRSAAMQYAASPDSMQQILMGAYPQLLGQGIESDDTPEADPPDDPAPEAEVPDDGNGDESGATEQRVRSIAARKRALSLLLINTGDLK